MAHNRTSLTADLNALGLGPGDWVMVHSSMKAIGWVEGGPEAVIGALVDAVGPDGLVMMPLLNRPRDFVDLSEEPTFLGLLPETFRRFPGVVRSPHPTHSMGVHGPKAREVAESHRNATFVGRGSPLHVLARKPGWVLHIGTDFSTSTILHLAEALAEVPYLDVAYAGYDRVLTARATDGTIVRSDGREVPGDSAMFTLVQEEMDRRDLLNKGPVGNAPSLLARADLILDVAVPMMREDPGRFLCNYDDCTVCPPSRELLRRLEAEGRLERKRRNE